jgi:tripartite-type tricarboxylate transporter receptor subunit TctC
MGYIRIGRWVAALVAVALLGGPADLAAQSYPSRPIRIIIPFPPGGAADVVARVLGQRINELHGQPLVLDNRPGAGGNLGAELAAHAQPDGYTLLMAPTSVYAVGASLYQKLTYDLVRDFAPVSMVANNPHVLVVNMQVPVNSVAELIALAKAQPGKLSVASQGLGTVSHLEGELFRTMAGIEWLHVPYKGSTPALTDLLGDQVQVFFDSVVASRPHVQGGKLKALGVTASKRTVVWPELPTIAEAGLPGYAAESWFAVLAPAATPPEVVALLNKAVVTIMAEPATIERLLAAGLEPTSSTPEAVTAHIKSEIAKWAPIVKASGARLE